MDLKQEEMDFKVLRNDLLEVIEDFRRGLKNYNEKRNELHPDAIIAHKNYQNLFYKINKIFTKLEIKMIENPLGKSFNPKYHDCVSLSRDHNLEDDIISSVISAGWTQRGIVIKPAAVIVNKKQ